MNISLPKAMKEWVEEQVASCRYASPSELIQELIREEKKREIRQQVDSNLQQALDSGESTPLTSADWARIRREGRKLIARKRKAQKQKSS